MEIYLIRSTFSRFVRFVSSRHPFLCRTSISKGSSITEATMPIFPPLRVIVSFRRDRKPFTWVTEPGTTCYSPSLSFSPSRWLENIFQHRDTRCIHRFILHTSYGSEVGNATDGTPTRDRKRGEWTLSYILSLLDNLMWFIVEAKLTVFFLFHSSRTFVWASVIKGVGGKKKIAGKIKVKDLWLGQDPDIWGEKWE